MQGKLTGFVCLQLFETTTKGILSGDDRREIESTLLENPEEGDRIEGTGGVRKLRFATAGARFAWRAQPK